MSFFAQPELPPGPSAGPPPWAGPAPGELATIVPVERFLARTDVAAVFVASVAVYSTGVVIDVAVRVREPRPDGGPAWFAHGPEPGDDFLRFGVELADGRRATNLARPPIEGDPTGPVLLPTRGTGFDTAFDIRFWLWPLPPPGPLALVCAWPAHAIQETRLEVDPWASPGAA
jgi:hypothetical protein